ncbi:MAG: HpsJ family protein [Oculatellaceae cyanobacterium Prado106]|jgi:hypothetical protein|nr:HpsJ family protein [Oculatellaceae cyanobacterium Prado106]
MQAEFQSSRRFYVALFLKIVGAILIVGILVDYSTLALPPDFLNNSWVANLIDQFVGRGVVPLLGFALVFLGIGVGQEFSAKGRAGKGDRTLILTSTCIALFLGLMFLVFTPLYFRSSQLVSASSSREINDQALNAENQLNQQLGMRRGQVSLLMGDEDRMAELRDELRSDRLSPQDKAQLQDLQETITRLKGDPKLLEEEVEKARQSGIEQIKARQDQAQEQLRTEMRRARLRITSISFLLAIGYLIIGWNTFSTTRNSESPQAKSRKPKAKKNSGQKRMRKQA